jgi:hypothetical protein
MKVDYSTYKQMDFTCTQCGWRGKGDQLVNSEFGELHAIGNLECPQCYHLIAFWQAPADEESEL